MTKRRHTTTCDRCGVDINHAYGAEPRYCDHCAGEQRLREARR